MRGWLRLAYTAGRFAARLGATPTAVTVIGLLLSVGASVAALSPAGAVGAVLAAVLVLLAAIADSVDGAVAVIAGRATRLGYVYDSVADRVSEACWLVALWVVGAPAWLVLMCGGLAWLHEYLRARAAVSGMDGGRRGHRRRTPDADHPGRGRPAAGRCERVGRDGGRRGVDGAGPRRLRPAPHDSAPRAALTAAACPSGHTTHRHRHAETLLDDRRCPPVSRVGADGVTEDA